MRWAHSCSVQDSSNRTNDGCDSIQLRNAVKNAGASWINRKKGTASSQTASSFVANESIERLRVHSHAGTKNQTTVKDLKTFLFSRSRDEDKPFLDLLLPIPSHLLVTKFWLRIWLLDYSWKKVGRQECWPMPNNGRKFGLFWTCQKWVLSWAKLILLNHEREALFYC